MPEDSPAPIGAPPGDWLVHAPPEGEWLIAVAIPPDADVPQQVLDAADAMASALGLPPTVNPESCVKNICNDNRQCTVRR